MSTAPVAYEYEFFRDTKDGNRQRVWRVTYDATWEDFAFHEAQVDGKVKCLTLIAKRTLVYAKT